MSQHKGWIAVDLDGTLAHYDVWRGVEHVGAPVPAMIDRVKAWLRAGQEVRIFTARVSPRNDGAPRETVTTPIEVWCLNHIGCLLPITHEKDMGMLQLWDDRCVQVIPNTGQRADGQE